MKEVSIKFKFQFEDDVSEDEYLQAIEELIRQDSNWPYDDDENIEIEVKQL